MVTPIPSAAFSLAIPTYNMCEHLVQLLTSIVQSSFYREVQKIIIVDDGSTDLTSERIQQWAQAFDPDHKIQVIRLETNQGRFYARLVAAEAAQTEFLFFIDTRIRLPGDFVHWVKEFRRQYFSLMVSIRIDPGQSLYSLYWLRSHHQLFRRTWEAEEGGYLLTAENFGQHVKGTTGLFCRTSHFLKACEPFRKSGLSNDDTPLLFELTKLEPIYRDSRLYAYWEPRQNLRQFLGHLFWDRGVSFAEYHVFEKWGKLSAGFFLGLAALGVLVAVAIVDLVAASWLLGAGLLLTLSSAVFFARGFIEFLRLAPLHLLVVLSFGSGICVGVIRVFVRRLRQSYQGKGQSA